MCNEDTDDTIFTPVLHLESLIESENRSDETTGHDPYNKAPESTGVQSENAA